MKNPLASMALALFFCAANAAAQGLTNIQTVFLIIMENHSWTGIASNTVECPFINNVLIPQAALAASYSTPPHLHPSEPNYIWLESGTNFGILDDSAANRIDSTNHLVTLLDRAGISWRAYYDGIPPDFYPITSQYPYVMRHNPQIFFNDVNSRTNYCIQHMRPMEELIPDLTNHTVARYNFIIPGMINDMHDVAPGSASARTQGDHWLSTIVPSILASRQFRENGALFLTWDEGDEDDAGASFVDGPLGMLLFSPFSKGSAYYSPIPYTHSSTLRTIQEIFNVRPLLGDAANAADLSDLFQFPTLAAHHSIQRDQIDITVTGIIPGSTVILQQAGPNSSWLNVSTNQTATNAVKFSLPCGKAPCYFRAAMLR